METLAERIKLERIKQGYTQEELADALDVQRAYISRIESGQKIPLRGDFLKRFAKCLHIEYEYLLKLAMLSKMDEMIKKFFIGDVSKWERARKILLK